MPALTLAQRSCTACYGLSGPLSKNKVLRLLRSLSGWRLSGDGRTISIEILLQDFMSAIRLIHRIAAIAEKEGHHPDLHLTGYRKLKIDLRTHTVGGLSENDFILAAKIDRLPKRLKKIKS